MNGFLKVWTQIKKKNFNSIPSKQYQDQLHREYNFKKNKKHT